MLALWLVSLQAVDPAEISPAASIVGLNTYRAVVWYHDPIKIAYAVIAVIVLMMVVVLAARDDAIIRE
jgi:hypothetical protein